MGRSRVNPKTYTCLVCGKTAGYRVSKRNIYCSITCQQRDAYQKFIAKWLGGIISGSMVNGPSSYIKRYLLEQQDNKCACCGIDSWNGKPIVLELEHIDGDSGNNIRDNLKMLCPNCHSQTPTYKGRNKGNGRHERRKRYAEGKSY